MELWYKKDVTGLTRIDCLKCMYRLTSLFICLNEYQKTLSTGNPHYWLLRTTRLETVQKAGGKIHLLNLLPHKTEFGGLSRLYNVVTANSGCKKHLSSLTGTKTFVRFEREVNYSKKKKKVIKHKITPKGINLYQCTQFLNSLECLACHHISNWIYPTQENEVWWAALIVCCRHYQRCCLTAICLYTCTFFHNWLHSHTVHGQRYMNL